MCKALKICRSTYYYEVNVVRKAEKEAQEHILTESIIVYLIRVENVMGLGRLEKC